MHSLPPPPFPPLLPLFSPPTPLSHFPFSSSPSLSPSPPLPLCFSKIQFFFSFPFFSSFWLFVEVGSHTGVLADLELMPLRLQGSSASAFHLPRLYSYTANPSCFLIFLSSCSWSLFVLLLVTVFDWFTYSGQNDKDT